MAHDLPVSLLHGDGGSGKAQSIIVTSSTALELRRLGFSNDKISTLLVSV
jgi:hypothetical protein